LKLTIGICLRLKYLTHYTLKGKVMNDFHGWINGPSSTSENGF
jgi:hypothetical protein